MKLAVLATKAARLPEINFDWTGPEQWHKDVFEREINTLPEAVKYIDDLRKRMAHQSMALHDLAKAYSMVRELILEAEVECGDTGRSK